MYGMRMDARATTPSTESAAAEIALRSRRAARAEERGFWIADDERRRAGRKPRLRLVHPGLGLVPEHGRYALDDARA